MPSRDKAVAVGCRLLGTDPDDIEFHVYRGTGKGEPKRLTDRPLAIRIHFLDTAADLSRANSYLLGDGMTPPPRARFRTR